MDDRCRQHPLSRYEPDKPDIGMTVDAPTVRVGIVVARRRLSTRCPSTKMSGLSGFYVERGAGDSDRAHAIPRQSWPTIGHHAEWATMEPPWGFGSRVCRVLAGTEPLFRTRQCTGAGRLRTVARGAMRAGPLMSWKPDKPDMGGEDVAPPRPSHAHRFSRPTDAGPRSVTARGLPWPKSTSDFQAGA